MSQGKGWRPGGGGRRDELNQSTEWPTRAGEPKWDDRQGGSVSGPDRQSVKLGREWGGAGSEWETAAFAKP